MKLLFEYTLDTLKRNRRSSFAIMVAVLMTAMMMSALCGFLYNVWFDNISYILKETGNWHGELYDTTYGSQLSTIASFDSVEAVMIKGSWKAAQIDDPRRDYLVWRDANAAYWDSMPEGDSAILEGRAPTQPGEIALSKQYFEHHPELKCGDSITLPAGDRISADRTVIDPQDAAHPGESFQQRGTVTLKIVGKMDVATDSRVPAYTALGFLTPEQILPDDDLTVYFRFQKIQDTYKELPKIAAAVGYQPDEYGNYLLRYNTQYLSRMGVLPPDQIDLVSLFLANQVPLMFTVMGLLVVSVFVLIIHNAFALSASARLTQLGIFASVGATPKQIKRSVVLEALLLTAIPLPIGLLLGQLAIGCFIQYANQLGTSGDQDLMQFSIGWVSVLPAVLLTLLTVWWAAMIPARKISRMAPIDAIRQGGTEKLKPPGRFSIARFGGLFGLPGELAANALQARKKSYRTAAVSLTLSFLTLASFLCISSASDASNGIYKTSEKRWAERDILLNLYNVSTPEDFTAISQKVGSLDGIKTMVWYNTLSAAVWLPEDGFSAKFEELGGFDAIEKKLPGHQIPLLRDGRRRVDITILGLDDDAFSDYCAALGIDPASFYEKDQWHSILYHTVNDITTSTKRNPVLIPFFDITAGERLTETEETYDSSQGDYTFETQITAVADHLPPIGSVRLGSQYSAVQIMPMSQVRELSGHFARNSAVRINGVAQVFAPEQITPVRAGMEQICESYFGSGDYRLVDKNEDLENQAAGHATTSVMFGFIVGILAVIGLSNAWSTVRGTLNARRREFAMLRSVGLPPNGMKKMLSLEAVMLGLTPILFSLPVIIVLQGVFLHINEVRFTEWLPYAPWMPVLIYTFAVLAATAAAYASGSRRLLQENIIEAIKVDSI